MDVQQKVGFPCPHCDKRVTTTFDVSAACSYDPATATTQVQHTDIMPFKCPHCGKFIQIDVANVTFDYEALAIKTT